MENSTGASKGKWGTPRIVRYFLPPPQVVKARGRQEWTHCMMLDSRLDDKYTRLILIRLIGHLNLRTQQCNPTRGTLALECAIPGSRADGERIVRRSLARAEKYGWVKRIQRRGGYYRNKSNDYILTLPASLQEIAGLHTANMVDRYADKIGAPRGRNPSVEGTSSHVEGIERAPRGLLSPPELGM